MSKRKEIWASVKGFEDKYEVSNTGRLRSKITGLDLKPLHNGAKYWYFIFYDPTRVQDNKRVKVYLHRLLALHFIPNPYFYNEVNHLDGDKWNCDLDNLEWVSKSQNSQHAFRTGLVKPMWMDGRTRGEGNFHAKVTWKQVREMRERFEAGEEGVNKTNHIKKLAKEYGLVWKTVWSIVHYKSWLNEYKPE